MNAFQDLGRHTLLLMYAAPVPELYSARSSQTISCVQRLDLLKRQAVLRCQKVSSHTTAGNHKWDVRQASYMHKM